MASSTQSRQKHGKGEGTIGRRADGRWEARLTLAGGRRKSFYGKTRQEVQQKLARARYELEERGIEPADERTLTAQYLTEWLAQVRDAVTPGTWSRY